MTRAHTTWGDKFSTQQQLIEFINDLVRHRAAYAGPERRGSERQLIVTEIQVQPLDLSLRSVDESFLAITRDISTSGIAFFHDIPTTPFVAVELEDPTVNRKIRAAVEVVRCEPKGPLFEIAGKFIYKIYQHDT